MKSACGQRGQKLLLALILPALCLAVPCHPAESWAAAGGDSQLARQIQSIDLRGLEKLIHDRVNEVRREHGLSSLEWDPKLADIARDHSRSMAEHGYVSHTDRQGRDPTDRGRAAGYEYREQEGLQIRIGIAENLFQGGVFTTMTTTVRNGRTTRSYDWNSPEEIADAAVRSWMKSPGHRKNILTPDYDSSGLGVAVAPDGRLYVTHNFC